MNRATMETHHCTKQKHQNIAFCVGGPFQCSVWEWMSALYKAEEGGGN